MREKESFGLVKFAVERVRRVGGNALANIGNPGAVENAHIDVLKKEQENARVTDLINRVDNLDSETTQF